MIVWGVDASSKCGLAIWDTTRNLASAHCEVIENKVTRDYYWFPVVVGRTLRDRVKQYGKPDMVVIERGSESTQGTGINGTIWCWDVIGAVNGVIGCYNTVIATILPKQWRNPFYGKGYVPPQLPDLGKDGKPKSFDKHGQPNTKNDWEAAILEKCARDGIRLPSRKATAHNAGEAVGIAHSWRHAEIINPEYKARFQQLLDDDDRFRKSIVQQPNFGLFGSAA